MPATANYEDYFPFSEGVPHTSAQANLHADGSVTMESSEMFVFSAPHPRWMDYPNHSLGNNNAATNEEVNCFHIPSENDLPSWEHSISSICSQLRNHNVSIVRRAIDRKDCDLLQQSMRTNCKANMSGAECAIYTHESFSFIQSPLIMALCDGVIGRQALYKTHHNTAYTDV
jgi:hypothetical protein